MIENISGDPEFYLSKNISNAERNFWSVEFIWELIKKAHLNQIRRVFSANLEMNSLDIVKIFPHPIRKLNYIIELQPQKLQKDRNGNMLAIPLGNSVSFIIDCQKADINQISAEMSKSSFEERQSWMLRQNGIKITGISPVNSKNKHAIKYDFDCKKYEANKFFYKLKKSSEHPEIFSQQDREDFPDKWDAEDIKTSVENFMRRK